MPLGKLQKDLRMGQGLPIAAAKSLHVLHGRELGGPNTGGSYMTVKNFKKSLAIIALAFTQTLPIPAIAADYDVGSIHISQPWTRATPKGASSGAAYMTITNSGKTPDRVSCVSSDASTECQIHTMTMENGVMKMRPVEGGLVIKPGETVTFKPSGLHVMLVGLKQQLNQNTTVKATLKFENAGTVDVDYPVAAIGARLPGASTGGSMMEGHDGMMQMDKH
jgi:periplasmic copper chaperone A